VVLALAASAAHAAPAEYGSIELIRDSWGVPHIFAETDAGAMYGLGYATAEDRGFQMHYSLRIIQGRLAEVIGDVKKVRRNETAVDNDRKMRTFGFDRAAEKVADGIDAESRALLEAYSHGVNDYFEKRRDRLSPVFDKVGLEPEPWTAADCLLSWWHLAQFFATDGTRDLMHYRNVTQGGRDPRLAGGRGRPGARGRALPPTRGLQPAPPDDSASVVGREDVTEEWIQRTQAFLQEHGHSGQRSASAAATSTAPKFSHAWVVGGKQSGSGGAVLVSMPQTPVTNPSLMYEFHISGKTLRARGIGVPGSPVILIGWNDKVAWGMTALGADQADLFRLKTDEDHPEQYEYDGQWHPMELLREEIQVRGSVPQTLMIRQTHFGPIVNEFAFSRPGDARVALKRVPVCERDRETIQGSLAMMRATDVHEFKSALAGWRFPSANVLFGDDQGNIGFSTAGALPLRPANALDAGGAAHDGSSSENDWQAIIPPDLVPQVINPAEGYLFSGNHRPVGAFYKIPLGIRTGSMGDTVRSWRLRQLLQGKTSLTPEQVLDMFRDPINPARREIARIGYHLRDVLQRELSQEAALTLLYLEEWYAKGAPSRLDVPGAEVGVLINTMFRMLNSELTVVYGGGDSGLARLLKTVGKRLDDDPEANIEPAEQEFVDRALAHAWETAERTYGRNPDRWHAVARRQVTEKKLGYCQSLDGFPSVDESLDMNQPALACTDGATVFSQGAQAYVQWVPLADVNLARSLLPPGQSERPDCRSRDVNVEAWVNGELHPAPLNRRKVVELAVSTTLLQPSTQ